MSLDIQLLLTALFMFVTRGSVKRIEEKRLLREMEISEQLRSIQIAPKLNPDIT